MYWMMRNGLQKLKKSILNIFQRTRLAGVSVSRPITRPQQSINDLLRQKPHLVPKNRQQRRSMARRMGQIKDWKHLNAD